MSDAEAVARLGEAGQPAQTEKMSIILLYGSETGTAEDIAVELGNMCQSASFWYHR